MSDALLSSSGKEETFDTGDLLVTSKARPMPVLAIAAIFGLLAILLFVMLNSRRLEKEQATSAPSPSAQIPAPPPPLPSLVAAPKPVPVVEPAVLPPSQPLAPPLAAVAAPPADEAMTQRLHAPSVVVDIQPGPAAGGDRAAKAAGAPGANAATGAHDSNHDVSLGPNEQFAARVADAGADSSVATQMTHLGTTIVQGTTVQALLETAVNSDLPGYVRAIVRRDIRGFDGTAVLIPRGSRVIGQYRNAQALGESRVFVIWTRLIRPDGVSVQLGSPGGDALGRGGLTGDVDSHFFARFGDAIMMSVLNAGVGAATGTPQTQIAIGSTAAAVGAAAAASMPRTGDIPPTIKVPQGAEVTIFLARDLDFSAVKALP
jgi:type IV secretion system protein VirB10